MTVTELRDYLSGLIDAGHGDKPVTLEVNGYRHELSSHIFELLQNANYTTSKFQGQVRPEVVDIKS